MNVYTIQTDGEFEVWAATSMAEATRLAEDKYIAELGDGLTVRDDLSERQHFRETLLDQCTLIGPLENWPLPSENRALATAVLDNWFDANDEMGGPPECRFCGEVAIDRKCDHEPSCVMAVAFQPSGAER